MKYKLIERKNPQKPNEPGKLYASPVNEGTVRKREIAADIVNISSLARGDVSNVIDSLVDTFPKYLLMGRSVNLDGFGTFRLSFTSTGVNAPEDFNASMISGVKIIFTPSAEIKKQIQDVKFTKSN